MFQLTPEQRRALKARAHALHPTVMIGDAGLSETVVAEIDKTLKAHELIKIRVHGDNRELREAMLAEICARLDAAPVQHIGKILVVFKPRPKEAASASAAKPASPVRTARSRAARPPAPGTRPVPPREGSAAGKGRSTPRATGRSGRGKRSP